MSSRSYFHIWYCLPKASREALKYKCNLTEDVRISLIKKADSTVAFKTVDTAKPSPNAKLDQHLSWSQITKAKNIFISNMHLGNYPPEHVKMFSAFYVNMELHPKLKEVHGERAFAWYHAKVHWDWYKSNEAGQPYDLSNINEGILQDCFQEIQSEDLDASIAQYVAPMS
ncbi:hypothetical protein Moror_4221 [Moniliophthora roreri MCA 2997]|uniref:Uncharacterized protein n=1 Tax=Moniliophthora roreri (strain MCA 2997) TaxID=1381753 RepID=V2WUW0_MONRO|nr:hypothetical protein Moror_4221 [Moniliophthora roreri MCA 2997]